MMITAGIDVGSTYTKVVVLNESDEIVGRDIRPTGREFAEVARQAYQCALRSARLVTDDVDCVVATGIGRHQVAFNDLTVTDTTACARGAARLFPQTRTTLDMGGQAIKASRLDSSANVVALRLNDRCAAGLGVFLERSARHLGFSTHEIGPLTATSKAPVHVSGICSVFAESEVIDHVVRVTPPSDIMQGAIESLVQRSVQLLKYVRGEPEYTLTGGVARFDTVARSVGTRLKIEVNVPAADTVQFIPALGAALLGKHRTGMTRFAPKQILAN